MSFQKYSMFPLQKKLNSKLTMVCQCLWTSGPSKQSP
ncbi:hypothetical protein MG1_02347 [Candida albicans GC75]|nr:hypothetical protein MG1_02347 [Candida albicans GC75]